MSKTVTSAGGIMDSFITTAPSSVNTVSSAADSFSAVMQKTTANQSEQHGDTTLPKDSTKVKDAQSNLETVKENSETASKPEKETEVESSGECPKEEDSFEAAETELKEAADRIVKEIADTLGITEEEVTAAMETLGLTALNLLDAAKLTEFMMTLSGETDRMALATNETLYTNIQDMLTVLKEELSAVKETFGLSDAQLNGCVEALVQEQPVELAAGTETEAPEQMPVFDMREFAESGEDTLEMQPEKAVVTLTKNGEEIKAVVETDVKTGAEAITQETGSLTKENEGSELMQNEGRGEQNKGNENPQGGNVVLQNLQQPQNTVSTPSSVEIPFTDTQVQDIMDQVMDFMKVQVKADTSSLEMQLHPESLGTLNIHIAAKEGILTAQFTTQSEAVKNAIEGQLATLQQNLNEQGIKVEAVEVNVATQQFERNLDQGQNGQPGNQSEEAKKKNVRRIDLNDLDSFEEEEMEDADKITADMMARNGNTVDYLA